MGLSWVSHSTLIYSSELILCSTINVSTCCVGMLRSFGRGLMILLRIAFRFPVARMNQRKGLLERWKKEQLSNEYDVVFFAKTKQVFFFSFSVKSNYTSNKAVCFISSLCKQ